MVYKIVYDTWLETHVTLCQQMNCNAAKLYEANSSLVNRTILTHNVEEKQFENAKSSG